MTSAGLAPTDLPPADALDVAELPDVAFGHRDIVWWGTVIFVVIEGFSLLVAATVWIYLSQHTDAWPPQGIRRPDWLPSVLQVALMLLTLPLAYWVKEAAERFDFRRTRLGLTIAALACAVFVLLRVMELRALNVRWDTNAYGSAQWLVVGFHGTLVLMQFVEMTGMALAFWFAEVEEKHFSDASDIAFYWWFLVLSWVPLAFLCYGVTQWS